MLTNKLTPLMCAIGLTLAGGVVALQGALAHDHGGMMDHDMMEQMDANHDGMVSAKEHADFANAMFARMDSNHDGMLSKDEMEAGHAMMHHEHEDNDDHEKDEHRKGEHEEHEHEEHEHGESRPMHHEMMAMMDANHDGMISAAEHADGMKAMFDQADTNHDGMLSRDEMKAAHERHEEMREKSDDKREEMKEKAEDAKESTEHGKQP